jgi:hypothetical protein
MLDKALAEVEASRIALKALEGEATAWRKSAESEENARKATERYATALEKQNDELRKIKCNETKFLFGVVKTKRCY